MELQSIKILRIKRAYCYVDVAPYVEAGIWLRRKSYEVCPSSMDKVSDVCCTYAVRYRHRTCTYVSIHCIYITLHRPLSSLEAPAVFVD